MQCFCAFLGDCGCFPTGPNVVPKIRKLVPDWIPTGQKRCPKMQKLVPDWVPTGTRRDPDWIHRSARTHSRTYFSLPRPTLAPIFLFRAPAVHQYPPPSCTKTAKAVLSQTGVLQHMYRMIHEYGSKLKTCRNHKFKSMFSINHPIIGVPNFDPYSYIYIYINRIFSHWSKHKRYYGT